MKYSRVISLVIAATAALGTAQFAFAQKNYTDGGTIHQGGGHTGKADPYTDGAKKPDPYTDGAKTGKFDPYTDGARSSTAKSDRSHVVL